MKRMLLVAAMFMMAGGLKAQNCEALVLPYFRGDTVAMLNYQTNAPEKFQYRCKYAQAAFYVSDTVPAGVTVYSIADVRSRQGNVSLPSNFVVDLDTFSYYAYNISDFQVLNGSTDEVVCFATPGSAHAYLVVRSMNEMHQIADAYYQSLFQR